MLAAISKFSSTKQTEKENKLTINTTNKKLTAKTSEKTKLGTTCKHTYIDSERAKA